MILNSNWVRSAGMALVFSTAVQAQADRAVAYLETEVKRWSVENHCFSCHNNGDGARALYIAGRSGSDDALTETARWLLAPVRWEEVGANAEFKDTVLAAIQFASALLESKPTRAKLLEAADILVNSQSADGTWHIDAAGTAGSPATWGSALATSMAVRVLRAADPARFASPIARASAWLRDLRAANVPDAAAAILAMSPANPAALDFMTGAQNADGGWGPWPHSPSEPFDTALAVLALSEAGQQQQRVVRGREFLLKTQQAAGGWIETTRPPGGRSYAQHISTSAWATIALIRTDSKGK